ncbi:Suppressor of the cold-sensitive snRNP biogenesis mutant brr1-1 [Sticta canariensis]|nr:Suppressor of the cold-sensitive snRNP biogenesis mutant brr1-1 [Sticta canariensis]
MIGVLIVVADEELDDEGSVVAQNDWQSGPTDAPLKVRQKRDEAILQKNAYRHLLFLSYPNQMSFVYNDDLWTGSWPGYRYFSKAGEGVVVYVIENGVNPDNDEFRGTGVIRGWLYAGNIPKTEDEYIENKIWKGHGSCGVSLVAGPKYGVAKNAKVIIVKNSFSEGSILDAFQKIINDLERRKNAGETIGGYTVVTLHGGFKKTTGEIKRQRLGQAIQRLLNDYQVVVVVAAGNSQQDGDVEIDTWPQLFSFDPLYSSMITVGAVTRDTGMKYPWSKGSPGANVWAPGEAHCAYGQPGGSGDLSSGTSVAAPIVAGLAAYFLSLTDVGDNLRQSSNIPMAVLQYIQRFSQPRNPNYPSIWNGLNSLQRGPNYGWQP